MSARGPAPLASGTGILGRGRLEVPRADGGVCVSPREELAMRLDLTEARVQVSGSGGTGTGASLGGAPGKGGPAPPGPSQRLRIPACLKLRAPVWVVRNPLGRKSGIWLPSNLQSGFIKAHLVLEQTGPFEGEMLFDFLSACTRSWLMLFDFPFLIAISLH